MNNKISESNQNKIFWGLQPSGCIHIGHFLTLKYLLQDLKDSKNQIIILLADALAIQNQKEVKKVEYYNQKLKKFFNLFFPKCKILHSSDFFKDIRYWETLNEFSNVTVNKITRGMPWDIRNLFLSEKNLNKVKFSQMLYTMLQVVDVSYLGLDKVYAGIDQTPVYYLALKIHEKKKLRPFKCKFLPILTQKGFSEKDEDFTNKISSSKETGKNFSIDGKTYKIIEKELEKKELTEKEKYIIRKLKIMLRAIACKFKNVDKVSDSDEELLESFKFVLNPVKDFEFSY